MNSSKVLHVLCINHLGVCTGQIPHQCVYLFRYPPPHPKPLLLHSPVLLRGQSGGPSLSSVCWCPLPPGLCDELTGAWIKKVDIKTHQLCSNYILWWVKITTFYLSIHIPINILTFLLNKFVKEIVNPWNYTKKHQHMVPKMQSKFMENKEISE